MKDEAPYQEGGKNGDADVLTMVTTAEEGIVVDDSHGHYHRTVSSRQLHVRRPTSNPLPMRLVLRSRAGNFAHYFLTSSSRSSLSVPRLEVASSSRLARDCRMVGILRLLSFYLAGWRPTSLEDMTTDFHRMKAGALGSLMAYGLVATCVFAVLQVLGEMTIAFPTSGNFIDYTDRFLDPSLAFAAGFAEWLGWSAVLGSEAVFFSIIVNSWTSAVPEAVWITIFVLGVMALFSLPNKWFAWFQYCASVIKVVALVTFLVLDFAIIMGAGSRGQFHDGRTWRENALFRNGFAGFSNACLLALWACGDQVFIGILGGEAASPRLAIGRAAKTVPVRVATVFLLTLLFSSLLINPDDPRLFGGSSTAQSPFTIAMQDAGIPGLYQFLNVAVLVSVFGFGTESIYISSRILRAMSHQRLIPQWFARVDSSGRPVWSLIATGAVSVTLTYMNLSGAGTGIFNWLISITSSAFFMVWGTIAVASLRFHDALKKQQDQLFSEVFAWRAWCFPLPAIWLLTCSIFLLVCCLHTGIKPLGSNEFSVENFFQYMLAVFVIIVFSVVHKLVTRSKVRRADAIDLRTDRRTLGEAEIAMLRQYYARPAWRRGLAYFKLW